MLNRVGVVRNDVSNVIMDGWMECTKHLFIALS